MLKCPICNCLEKKVGYADYRIEVDKFVKVAVYYCDKCDIYSKELSDDLLDMHFSSAGYCRLEHEEEYFRERMKFFNYLLSLITKETKETLNILDIGCSYGHFLKICTMMGHIAEGVEVNESLLTYLQKQGYKVYKNIYEVRKNYDVISFIDSFYYFKDPVTVLERCKNLLKEDGLLLFRLTNRNWLAKVKKDLNILGDATHAYSIKSISKLLNKTGFRIKKLKFVEQGKDTSIKKRLFYLLTYLLTFTTLKRLILSPGLIIVAEKIK